MRYGYHKILTAQRRDMLLEIWGNLCAQAKAIGRADLIEKYRFPDGAGYRRIDKSTAPFQQELDALLTQIETGAQPAP